MKAATRTRAMSKIPPGAVGQRGIALLRRLRAEGGRCRLEKNGDREAAEHCAREGFVHIDRREPNVVYMCDEGIAFLDRLMRAD